MNGLAKLISVVGDQKALILVCGECASDKYIDFDDRIFIQFLSARRLQHYDPLEKGRIQYYIESKECKQVIIAGSLEPTLTDFILQDDSFRSIRSALEFNLSVLLHGQNNPIVPMRIRSQLLVELHIISQCSLLMDYYFIRERVENKQLRIRGILAKALEDQVKPIFHNGIIYNAITSMN